MPQSSQAFQSVCTPGCAAVTCGSPCKTLGQSLCLPRSLLQPQQLTHASAQPCSMHVVNEGVNDLVKVDRGSAWQEAWRSQLYTSTPPLNLRLWLFLTGLVFSFDSPSCGSSLDESLPGNSPCVSFMLKEQMRGVMVDQGLA